MKQLLLIMCLALFSLGASATHIMGGFITFTKDTSPNANPRKFHFKLTIISDHSSQAEDPTVQINMGGLVDITVPRASVTTISHLMDQEEFHWDYTFPTDGTYNVSWTGINRNPGILNIANPSDQLTVHIKTTVSVNSLQGPNSSPQFLAPESINATVGQPINFNLLAYDPDGDSLVYKLYIPQQKNHAGNVLPVLGYTYPVNTFSCNNTAGTGSAIFKLNSKDGQITWDAPCKIGDYTVAILVEEWRNDRRMSVVTYDMTIRVESGPEGEIKLANKDELEINSAGYIVAKADRQLELKINYTQLEQALAPVPVTTSQQTRTEYFASELSQVFKVPVTYTFEETATGVIGTFRFTPTEELMRDQPYFVSFYAQSTNYGYFNNRTVSFGIVIPDNEPSLKLLEAEKLPRLPKNVFVATPKEPITFKVLAEALPGYVATIIAESSLSDGAEQFAFTTINTTEGTIGELEFLPTEAQVSMRPRSINFKATYTSTQMPGDPIVKELDVQVIVQSELPNAIKYFLKPRKFFIFPNNVQDRFAVEAETPALLTIHNLQGKLILEQQLPQGLTEISRPSNKAGLYIYTLTTQDGQKTTGKLMLK